MKRTLLIVVIVVVGVFVVLTGGAMLFANRATGGAPVYYDAVAPNQGMGGGGGDGMTYEVMPAAPEFAAEDMDRASANPQAAAVERLVIKNADLAIVVTDVKVRAEEIARLADEMGGFVVSSSLYEVYVTSGRTVPEATLVIRVPSERLDEALERIKSGTVEVDSENISGQDVTAEYVDLQSRLRNLEAAEAQLVEILEQAQETEDVLNVFNQLTAIREQIELVKGQIKYYEESASLSAISVRIIAEETIQPIEILGWKPDRTAREAIQDLVYFAQDFVDFLIRLALFVLPTLILIAIPVYLVFLAGRAVYRRFWQPQAASVSAEKPKTKK